MEERQGWSEAPHEQLVGAFRGLLWQKRQFYGELAPNFPPAKIIRDALIQQETPSHVVPYAEDKQRREFFKVIRAAWDVIAYEHYRWKRTGEDAWEQTDARWQLSLRHWNAKDNQEPRPEIITLNPQQAQILDALAEAADIPYQRGSSEITIPEHSRNVAEEFVKQDEGRQRAEDERRRGK